jgi:hypothetical protein
VRARLDRVVELPTLRRRERVVGGGVEAMGVRARGIEPGEEKIRGPIVVVCDRARVEAAAVEQIARPVQCLAKA